MTWIDNQIKGLEVSTSKYKEIIDIKPKIVHHFTEATALKLIFLKYYLDIYSAIISSLIKKKEYFENMFYVDLFSGSGLNKLKPKNDFLFGSPFIATLNHKEKFKQFIFCDKDSDCIDALSLRFKAIKIENYKMLPGDCNSVVKEIIKGINKYKKPHSFFFIDPHSLEIKWKSMEKILSSSCDILFTFMTKEIDRARKSAFVQRQNKTEVLDKFYGGKSWDDPNKTTVEIYIENINKARPNALIIPVKIVDHYHLIFITKITKGRNPWAKGCSN